MTSAGITGAIQAVVTIVSWLGYSNAASTLDGMTQALVAVGLGSVTLGGLVVHALHAQAQVTPLAAPQTTAGEKLVPDPASAVITDSVGAHAF